MLGVENSNSGYEVYTFKSSNQPEPLFLWGKRRSEMISDNLSHRLGMRSDQNRRERGQCFGIMMSIITTGLELG